MPMMNIRRYAELVEALERFADGAQSHQDEPDFPSVLKEAVLRQAKTELEDSREAYDKAVNEARKAYETYEAIFKTWKEKLANYRTMVYGFYGKKNPVVADFGLAPHKTGQVKR